MYARFGVSASVRVPKKIFFIYLFSYYYKYVFAQYTHVYSYMNLRYVPNIMITNPIWQYLYKKGSKKNLKVNQILPTLL
jgi:hypothetical protein